LGIFLCHDPFKIVKKTVSDYNLTWSVLTIDRQLIGIQSNSTAGECKNECPRAALFIVGKAKRQEN